MKSEGIEKLLREMSPVGLGPNEAISLGVCAFCGKDKGEFTDNLSRVEYGISAMCQACQNKVFSSQLLSTFLEEEENEGCLILHKHVEGKCIPLGDGCSDLMEMDR